ncbi:MAG: prepilin-type N-terminal cleavage/methylation domain-containing protein [Desulfomicrobiaceae bacterium]
MDKARGQRGFTLIEMAIVLVIIGLILGMVFKGRELIASAKVKNGYAAYNKVLAGMNTFLDRYGFYPGDGCSSPTPASPAACTGTKDGIVNGTNEQGAFFYLLTQTGILTDADTRSALGSDNWSVAGDANQTWIYTNGSDLRLICDLDRIADDGKSNNGTIRANTSGTSFTGDTSYNPGDDCWAKTGSRAVMLKILP